MFKLVRSLLRGRGGAKKPDKKAPTSSYVPLFSPHQETIFPDFRKVSTVQPRVALKVQAKNLRPCCFSEHLFLFSRDRVLIFDRNGRPVDTQEIPQPLGRLFPIDGDRLLYQSDQGETSLWNWRLKQWARVQSCPNLVAVAWCDREVVLFLRKGGREDVHLLDLESLAHSRAPDQTLEGRLQIQALPGPEGEKLESARLSPLSRLSYKVAPPLGPGLPPSPDPEEKIFSLRFDPRAPGAERTGQPEVHWVCYPAHEQDQEGAFTGYGHKGRVIALVPGEDEQAVLLYWEDKRLVPARCHLCGAGVRVDSTTCVCGTAAPATGIRTLSRTLMLAPDFEDLWQAYLKLREESKQAQPPPGEDLHFGHVDTGLRVLRSGIVQAGCRGEDGEWEFRQVLEDVSLPISIRDGLALHWKGRALQVLTSLAPGEVTVLAWGRLQQPVLAAQVCVWSRTLLVGTESGLRVYPLNNEEAELFELYDEFLSYYDVGSGIRRPLSPLKSLALSRCRRFLFVFCSSAHTYRVKLSGLEYLGCEDLLAYYGRTDEQGRVLAHKEGRSYTWCPEELSWKPYQE